jgi:hypothetical protein
MPYYDMYLALSPNAQTAFYIVACYGLGNFACDLSSVSDWLDQDLVGADEALRKEVCRFILYDLRPLHKSVEKQLAKSNYETAWTCLAESPGVNEEAAIEVLLNFFQALPGLIEYFHGDMDAQAEDGEEGYTVEQERPVEDEYTVEQDEESSYEVLSGSQGEFADPRIKAAWDNSPDHRDWLERCGDVFATLSIQAPLQLIDAISAPARSHPHVDALIDMGMDKMSFGEDRSVTWVRGLLSAIAGQWVDAEQCLRRLSPQSSEDQAQLSKDRFVALLGSKNWSSASSYLQELEKSPDHSYTPGAEYSCRRLLSFNLFGLTLRLQKGFNEDFNVVWPLCVDGDEFVKRTGQLQRFGGSGISSLKAVGDKNGDPYLIYESQGGSLLNESLVSLSSLFMTEATFTVGKLARALNRLHDSGAIHGAIHRGSLEQLGYGGELRWTGACPGIDYRQLLGDLSARGPVKNIDMIAPELRDRDRFATIDSDRYGFGRTLLDLLKEANQGSGDLIEQLKACAADDPKERRRGFHALIKSTDKELEDSNRTVLEVSVKIGPPSNPKRLNEALKTVLGILETPKDRDEACLLGQSKKRIEDAMKVVKTYGSKGLHGRLLKKIPSAVDLKLRRSMIFIDAGTMKGPDGRVTAVAPFLIESQGRFAGLKKLTETRCNLDSKGLRLPTLQQWLRILDEKPQNFRLSNNQHEWIREKQRRGRHVLGRAICFEKRGRNFWTWPFQTYWLPGHRPGAQVSGRGVIDLRGS